MNKLLSHSYFPDASKIGIVFPITKVASPSPPADWRPITILPALSKILETLLSNQISVHVDSLELLSPFQSGFRERHSTTTALIKVVSDIRRSCDSGDVVPHVLLDLSRAFDSVLHSTLVGKLSTRFGFSSSACALIGSYLAGRHQLVYSNGFWSSILPLCREVPQGAVLAPLLFLMFVDDLPCSIMGLSFHLHADDLQLYGSSPVSELDSAISSLNGSLVNISEWCTSNGLLINPLKSQAAIYSASTSALSSLATLPPVLVNGVVILYVKDHVKNLGLLMDPSLKWKHHVNLICSRVYFGLRTLYSISHHLPVSIRLALFKALILPHFFYGSEVFYPLQATLLSKLDRAMNAYVRYVFKLRCRDRISPFISSLVPGLISVLCNISRMLWSSFGSCGMPRLPHTSVV